MTFVSNVYTNSSTGATASSSSSWWVGFTFDLYQYEIAYLDPLMVLSGLLGNGWAALLFVAAGSRTSRTGCLGDGLQLSLSLRLYYTTIAIADLVDCARNIPWDLVCNTAAFFSNNTIYFCFASFSNATCVVIHYWYIVSETISNYTLVALSVERFVAVYFPLWFRSHSTFQRSALLLAFICLPPLVLLCVLNPLGSQVLIFGPQSRICSYSPDTIGVVSQLTIAFVLVAMHSIIELLILALVLFQLRRAHRRRIATLSGAQHQLRDSNAGLEGTSKSSSSSVRANDASRDGNTIAMIALCTINAAVYVSAGLSQLVQALVWSSPNASADAKDMAQNMFLVFIIFSTFPHAINVFVYLLFLPRFRRATLCCPKQENNSHRASSTFQE